MGSFLVFFCLLLCPASLVKLVGARGEQQVSDSFLLALL